MSAPPPTARRKQVQVVKALYKYQAQRSDELTFEEGDVLYVISKDQADWWLCKVGDREGLVPSNYVGENTMEMDNPLHEAAKRGNVEFCKELLQAGISPNSLDKAGNAPIHWASRSGHLPVVELLLKANVTVNTQNKLGDTPLHLAAWGGHAQVVEMLLSVPGIQAQVRNNEKMRPVDLAKGDQTAALLVNFMGTPGAQSMAQDSDED